jgi:hypothetical protein
MAPMPGISDDHPVMSPLPSALRRQRRQVDLETLLPAEGCAAEVLCRRWV